MTSWMFRSHSSFIVHGPLHLGLFEEGKSLLYLHFPSLDCCLIKGCGGTQLSYDGTVIVSWAFITLVSDLQAVVSFRIIYPVFSVVLC